MHNNQCILLLLVVALLAVVLYGCQGKTVEGYADLFYNRNLSSNMMMRPSFNSNLDPNNMNIRYDPHVYGGYIKGVSPPPQYLATDNTIESHNLDKRNYKMIEGFESDIQAVNDAAQFVNYKSPSGQQAPEQNGMMRGANYQAVAGCDDYRKTATPSDITSQDYIDMVNPTNFQAKQAEQRYKLSQQNIDYDAKKYMTPQELLPVPDMRQPLMKDPSNPANFMYTRTLFAPLKTRNLNTPDRVRGDLDIAPVKTGWFDTATVPSVDLAKGYFGYYNDIEQFQQVQDVAYQRSRDEATRNNPDLLRANNSLTKMMTRISEDMIQPRLTYSVPPPLESNVPVNNNPWFNSKTGYDPQQYKL